MGGSITSRARWHLRATSPSRRWAQNTRWRGRTGSTTGGREMHGALGVVGVETVIASEAKQSISPRKERVDCFVASLLAMTLPQFPNQDSPSSRRDASEGLQKPSRLLQFRGRRECRAHDAPAASCVKKTNTRA